jgi:hypothetical protein
VLNTEPSPNLIRESLFACYTFAQIMRTIGRLYDFDFAGADAEMVRVAQEGLRLAERPR